MKRLWALIVVVLVIFSISMIATASRVEIIGEEDYNRDLLAAQICDTYQPKITIDYAKEMIDRYGYERLRTLVDYKYRGQHRLFLTGHEYDVWAFDSCVFLKIYDYYTEKEIVSTAWISIYGWEKSGPMVRDFFRYIERNQSYVHYVDLFPGEYNVQVCTVEGKEINFRILVSPDI